MTEHVHRFTTDIQRVMGFAVAHVSHATWPARDGQARDTVADTLDHLVACAERGDFPSVRALRKTCAWTLCELYWKHRWHGLGDSDREVRAAARRLLDAIDSTKH